MIREQAHQGAMDTRKRPQQGQKAGRTNLQGYMQPSEQRRTGIAPGAVSAQTQAPAKTSSALKKALIAGGITAAGTGGMVGLFSLLS